MEGRKSHEATGQRKCVAHLYGLFDSGPTELAALLASIPYERDTVERGICKLCGLQKDLQDSHLMPAGIYRRTRSPGAPVQDPLSVFDGGIQATSEQLTDFVFCSDCEERFNKYGENYIHRMVSTKDDFPLLDILNASRNTPLKEWGRYAERDTPTIDRAKIAYFAVSVFWRASVHVWKWNDGRKVTIDLGKQYNESCRRYLLGETQFPEHLSLFVIVATDVLTQDTFVMPGTTGRLDGGGWGHSMGARGIIFWLTLGKDRPKHARETCCITSTEKWIWTRDYREKTLEAIERKVPMDILVAWAKKTSPERAGEL